MPLDRRAQAITRDQAMTARRLLGWSRERLAQMSGVAVASIFTLERIGAADDKEVTRIKAALQAAGVEFTGGDEPDEPGVRCLGKPT
jgi:ribosome-binding protein aMBF1 (putative translation factor)